MVLSKFIVLEQKTFRKCFFFSLRKQPAFRDATNVAYVKLHPFPDKGKTDERGEGAATPMISSLPAK